MNPRYPLANNQFSSVRYPTSNSPYDATNPLFSNHQNSAPFLSSFSTTPLSSSIGSIRPVNDPFGISNAFSGSVGSYSSRNYNFPSCYSPWQDPAQRDHEKSMSNTLQNLNVLSVIGPHPIDFTQCMNKELHLEPRSSPCYYSPSHENYKKSASSSVLPPTSRGRKRAANDPIELNSPSSLIKRVKNDYASYESKIPSAVPASHISATSANAIPLPTVRHPFVPNIGVSSLPVSHAATSFNVIPRPIIKHSYVPSGIGSSAPVSRKSVKFADDLHLPATIKYSSVPSDSEASVPESHKPVTSSNAIPLPITIKHPSVPLKDHHPQSSSSSKPLKPLNDLKKLSSSSSQNDRNLSFSTPLSSKPLVPLNSDIKKLSSTEASSCNEYSSSWNPPSPDYNYISGTFSPTFQEPVLDTTSEKGYESPDDPIFEVQDGSPVGSVCDEKEESVDLDETPFYLLD